ncbi:MAG: hypothetical protein ACLUB0_11630 [Blautia hansenii]
MGDTKYGLIGIQLDSNATEEMIAKLEALKTMILSLQISVKAITNNATYWAARIVCYGF